MARSLLALCAALFAVSFIPTNAPADTADLPHPDIDYTATQLATMSSSYLMRYSGFDGDPTNPSDPANQPPQVNGWQEFFQHWKEQLRSSEFGSFAKAGAIADHYFDVSEFGAGTAPNKGDVPVLTIPGASCPGQSTLVASHPDSTPGLNTGNGSTYDDTSGVTMGMGETAGLAKWWDKNGTWPDRTYKLGLFDAEEVGLDGSYYYAGNLIPKGPQGQYVLVANMDQNGLEYPAFPLGNTQTTWNPGPWVTNVNASPVKDFSLSDYNDGHGHANAAIAAHMPAIERFRAALADSVRQAFADQGAKYGHKVPLQNGTAPAYDAGDIAKYYRLQDDTLGRTDQVPFVAQGIPGFGVLGAFDSNPDDNPLGATPASPLGDGSIFGIPQVAGYDTPRDNVAHFNLLTQGIPDPTTIQQAGRQALDLPATWTSYLLARPEYAGAAPRPSAPIAYFEALPTAPKPGDKISFDARASVDPGGKGLTYLWDFGDGTTGTGATPQHAYDKAGWYSPILVVRDAAGDEVGYQQSIDVGDTKDAAPQTDPCGLVASEKASSVAEAVTRANPDVAAPAAGSPASGGGASRAGVACAAAAGFRRVAVSAHGRAVRFSIARARRATFAVDVFQASRGRRVVGNRRVFHRAGLSGSLTWTPGALPDGEYFARATMRLPGGRHDVRRATLRIAGGRITVTASHYRRESCGVIGSFKLGSPAFGGTTKAPLTTAYRLGRDVDAARIDVLRGGKVVRRLATAGHELARITYRAKLAPAGLPHGLYRVRLTLRLGGRTLRAEVAARRL